MSDYQVKYPNGMCISANTLCVVGVCTCLMMKMAVEKAFDAIGITNYDIMPATEDNPFGNRDTAPDVIFCEPLRIDEVRLKVPNSLVIEIEDIANHEKIKETIVNNFLNKGWLYE